MTKRIVGLLLIIPALCILTQVRAQDADNTLVWSHGLNLQVRPAGVDSFDEKKTVKFGAEVFNDMDLKKAAYVLDTAAIGVGVADKLTGVKSPKAPTLFHALELRVRKPGEADFTDKTKKYGIEVFNDVNAGNLVYVSETGAVATVSAEGKTAPEEGKIANPKWYHGLELKVRKAGEENFDKAMKLGLEVYKDPNTNQLVYISTGGTEEGKQVAFNGSIAVVDAGDTPAPEEVKTPTWFYAFEVKVRKADEEEFTKDTRSYGVEVYKDENANNLIFVCETGAIAVAPAGGVGKPGSSKAPTWKFGRAFRVRRFDEPDFNDKTQRFGAEVYLDEISKKQLYITDKGWITVVR